MPKLKVNDISLYYEMHGSGEPIVFIAGLAADHNIWDTVIPDFFKNYQVILLDNRGSGRSDCPNCMYNIESMADDTVELINKLGISKAHFIGSSMGGAIVQHIAYKYPEHTKSIVIENSTYKFQSLCLKTIGESILSLMKKNAYSEDIFRITLHFLYSEKFLSKNDMLNNITRMVFQNPYPITTEGYIGQLNACMTFDSSDWLHQIQLPTLVITSGNDLLVNRREAKQLVKKIPNAEYYYFKEAGHLPHIEFPKEFYNVVIDFLERHHDKSYEKIL